MSETVAVLSSKYIYIRCDGEFSILFDNGISMPMWRGFYCFKTEDLIKNQSSGASEIKIIADDFANVWWLSTDTLIMSVTDINNQTINYLGQLLSNNTLSQIQSTNANLRIVNLLESIQNSFSTFLNAYVEANTVTDFGFITATIGDNLVGNVYIAKSDKYSFNCSLVFSHSVVANYRVLSVPKLSVAELTRDNFLFCEVNSTASTYSVIIIPKNVSKFIDFNLFNNNNILLSGYSVSNVSGSLGVIFPENTVFWAMTNFDRILDSNICNIVVTPTVSYDSVNSKFEIVPFTSVNVLTVNVPHVDRDFSLINVPITERLEINFNVSKI